MLQIAAAASFAPSLEFVNSSAYADRSKQTEFSFEIKPDVCTYVEKTQCRGPTDVAHAELLIEFK
jgi:hypothetical protein